MAGGIGSNYPIGLSFLFGKTQVPKQTQNTVEENPPSDFSEIDTVSLSGMAGGLTSKQSLGLIPDDLVWRKRWR
ncbi:MAG: hypothetical protein HYU64_04690 [Armatimonadetes bacterium]|nr:hypothetical protein [Armatimonadota bacterium]